MIQTLRVMSRGSSQCSVENLASRGQPNSHCAELQIDAVPRAFIVDAWNASDAKSKRSDGIAVFAVSDCAGLVAAAVQGQAASAGGVSVVRC